VGANLSQSGIGSINLAFVQQHHDLHGGGGRGAEGEAREGGGGRIDEVPLAQRAPSLPRVVWAASNLFLSSSNMAYASTIRAS
jgi:hypothetical protein